MTLVHDRRIGIRAITPADLAAVYALETDPQLGQLWRFEGRPGLDAYIDRIQAGLLLGCVIELNSNQELVGAAFAHNYNARTITAEVALVESPARSGSAFSVAGFGMFVNYLFEEYPLRRIFAWTGSANLGQFKHALGTLFTRHVLLDAHVRAEVGGDDTDNPLGASRSGDARHLLSIERALWFEQFRPLVLSRIRRWVGTDQMTDSVYGTS